MCRHFPTKINSGYRDYGSLVVFSKNLPDFMHIQTKNNLNAFEFGNRQKMFF